MLDEGLLFLLGEPLGFMIRQVPLDLVYLFNHGREFSLEQLVTLLYSPLDLGLIPLIDFISFLILDLFKLCV